MERLTEFSKRIDSFEKTFDLGQEDFRPNKSVLDKVDENNRFKPFYGDTAVFVLSEEEQAYFKNFTDILYQEVPECFAERIDSRTFHMTLHDLSNSPVLADVQHQMNINETKLRNLMKEQILPCSQIAMTINAVFNLNHTALVVGLTTIGSDYHKLMQMYELMNEIRPLPYPFTPHITLAYYNWNGFSAESGRKLTKIVNELNQKHYWFPLDTQKLFYQHFDSMANYQNLFCLDMNREQREKNYRDIVLAMMEEAGWSETRKIDISEPLAHLKKEQYAVSDSQRAFLENFNGLQISIHVKRYGHMLEETHHFTFDCQEWCIPKKWLSFFNYQDYAESPLIPIGFIAGENIVLLIDEQLRIYGVWEHEMSLMGDNIFDVFLKLYADEPVIWDSTWNSKKKGG